MSSSASDVARRLDGILRAIPDIVYRVNPDGTITFINEAVAQYGYSVDGLLGESILDIVHPDDLDAARHHVTERRTGERRTRAYEVRLVPREPGEHTGDGEAVACPVFLLDAEGIYGSPTPMSGALLETQGIARDITERKRFELALMAMTKRDPLTGLPNRLAFEERLTDEWRRAQRTGACVSVVMADIDRFKEFNDENGHLAGDECLRTIADALRRSFQRAGDLAARWGGEEFTIVVADGSLPQAAMAAERFRAEFEAAGIRRGAGRAESVTVSAGVAGASPGSGTTTTDLVAAADAALYLAKQRGRNRVVTTPCADASG
jgi:diguanylate cyclase (GGDEF)-like protein/PAS domain S-box-containing protein